MLRSARPTGTHCSNTTPPKPRMFCFESAFPKLQSLCNSFLLNFKLTRVQRPPPERSPSSQSPPSHAVCGFTRAITAVVKDSSWSSDRSEARRRARPHPVPPTSTKAGAASSTLFSPFDTTSAIPILDRSPFLLTKRHLDCHPSSHTPCPLLQSQQTVGGNRTNLATALSLFVQERFVLNYKVKSEHLISGELVVPELVSPIRNCYIHIPELAPYISCIVPANALMCVPLSAGLSCSSVEARRRAPRPSPARGDTPGVTSHPAW